LFRCKVFKGNSIKTLHFLQFVSRIAGGADIQSMPLNAKPQFCGFLRSLKGLKNQNPFANGFIQFQRSDEGVAPYRQLDTVKGKITMQLTLNYTLPNGVEVID